MSKKLTVCKACGKEIAKNAKSCPGCGAKNKSPLYKKWWFWMIVVVLLLSAFSGEEADTDNTPNQALITDHLNATNQSDTQESTSTTSTTSTTVTASHKTEFFVGDAVMDGNTKIVYISSGEYIEENDYLQPQSGNKYIFLEFSFENISKNNDVSISFYNFDCYADGYAAEMYYGGEDDLSATLSAGRSTSGHIYFEIPANAEQVEIEYTTNAFTDEKIKFIYEGEKDSGYVPERNTTASPDAHQVGDIIESSQLIVTYMSCEEYVSENDFIQPRNGYQYIVCEFEFENIGKSDEYISSWDFDCFADGMSCEQIYMLDTDLSATLSSGRKTKGTVMFEVPIDATVIEAEYLSNYWTSNRIVFTVK